MNRRPLHAFLILCSTLSIIASSGCATKEDPTSNEAVFQAAWSLVDEHYYDQTFNGYDWDGIRNVYSLEAMKASNPVELYWHVINPMLSLLETSHLTATTNAKKLYLESYNTKNMSVMEPKLGRCAGLTMAWGRRSIASSILDIDRESYLFKKGVRAGWKIEDIEMQPTSNIPMDIIWKLRSPDGRNYTIEESVADSENVPDVMLEIQSWIDAQKSQENRAQIPIPMQNIGLRVMPGRYQGAPYIVTVRNESSAERAGVEPRWSIINLQDSDLGNEYRALNIQLLDDKGKVHAKTLNYSCDTDDYIDDKSYRVSDDGVGVLRFSEFSAESVSWAKQQIHENAPNGLIIDFRGNFGGAVDSMQRFLGTFLPTDVVIGYTKTKIGQSPLYSIEDGAVYTGPIVVVVGPLSASAAEVSAVALRHHLSATIVGSTTAGEAVVSNAFALPDGGQIQVATSDFIGADGQRIERVGVEPDVFVQDSIRMIRENRDTAVEVSIELLSSPKEARATRTETSPGGTL